MRYVVYFLETGELSQWGETPDDAVFVPDGMAALLCPEEIPDPGPKYHVVSGVLAEKETPPVGETQEINQMTFSLEVVS